jgi:hypothetical protein
MKIRIARLHTAGSYAIFSGLVIVIATRFVLASNLPPHVTSFPRRDW